MKDIIYPLGYYPRISYTLLPIYLYKRLRTGVISRLGNFLYFSKSIFLPILPWTIFNFISFLSFKHLYLTFYVSSFGFSFSFYNICFLKKKKHFTLLSYLIMLPWKLCKRDLSPQEPKEGMVNLDVSHVLILTVYLIWFNTPAVYQGGRRNDTYC